MESSERLLSHHRRTLRGAAAAALALALGLAGCGSGARPPTAAEAELERGGRFAEAVLQRQRHQPATLTGEEVIVLGYLERHRLGLGSPFRLAEHALLDPRLGEALRPRLAAALLQRTLEGRGYELGPGALSLMGTDSAGRAPETARRHAALVFEAVSSAEDPRVGELAVRAAYTVVAAEGVVTRTAPTLAAHAAALARDRALASRDVERLLAEAEAAARHPLAVLREWRAGRRFEVEIPAGNERPPAQEVLAARGALGLARAAREATAGGWSTSAPSPEPLLGPVAAARLAVLAARHDRPPSAPVRVTLERYREDLQRELGHTASGREAARRFLAQAGGEERFAAEHARLAAHRPPALVGLVAMEAAVAMRPLAQEPVWFPGFPAPAAADLRRTYGLAAVEFGPEVPAHWEGYYRRMLGGALAELEAVLPGLDLQGLSIHFGETGREGTALAVHDPRTRTIRLPPGTGPGTLAHEIAHDLDWQVALSRYGVRGSYGTDLALRRGPGDPLAAAVRDLQASPGATPPGPDAGRRAWETRPAESFARMFDGWVAATMAARGRSDGHLSALQDEVLTAYGMAVVPDVRGWDAEALLPLLMVTAPLSRVQEAEFRATWSPGRTPGPLRLLAEVAAAPSSAKGMRTARPLVDRARLPAEAREQIAEVERRRAAALAQRAELVCANPFLSPVHDGEPAVRALIDAAADARIRGILRRQARAQGLDATPEALRAAWVDDGAERAEPRRLGALPGSGAGCGAAPLSAGGR